MTVRQVQADAVPPQPWRNGGGRTRALWCWPDTAGDAAADDTWRLRISLADIETDGPFSAFPGVLRWFTVVGGAGVVLTLAGEALTLTPGSAPLQFDGAAAPGCRLLNGPTRDLNLMLRGASGRMDRTTPGQPWRPDAAVCGLFTTTAGCCVAHGPARQARQARQAHDVPAHTLLWFDAAPTALVFTPHAAPTPPTPAAGDGPPVGWWLAATPWPGAAAPGKAPAP